MVTLPSHSFSVFSSSGQERKGELTAEAAHREFDDLVEHDIWRNVEVEDKVLERKEQRI